MKKPVGKEMKIKMELIRRRTGNEIYMYLYDDNMWYYFEYSDKSLYALSSSAEYNEIIKNEKADKKDIRDKDKQLLYTITLCPDSKKERFLKRIGEGGLWFMIYDLWFTIFDLWFTILNLKYKGGGEVNGEILSISDLRLGVQVWL